MKVFILIHRQMGKEPAAGTLKAHVVVPFVDANGKQCYLRGTSLLRGQICKVDDAVAMADPAVLEGWKLGDAPEIEYIIEEAPNAS